MRLIQFGWIWRGILLFFTMLILFFFFAGCDFKKQNRLSKASSPYLQQHADNPVNWYEWGDEALQRAKKENKPLLISVGYSSCHWCHQMEKESFMDTAVARLMNENFVCIKVDREERPDIDNIYMNACQLISGNSGWPLNAFALPDGKPFFAGTYYSKQSWTSLLKQLANAYATQSKKVELQAWALSSGIAKLEFSVLTDSVSSDFDKPGYQQLFEKLYQKLDLSFGGLQGNPKFPSPVAIEFLLQYYFLTKDKRALDAATTTLTKMALGGIYDHIGGGFARYSIDSLWRIPHFEKMLYDNAQLISVYAHAYQLTGDNFFKETVQDVIGFVQRELRHPDGGYFSSINADTKDGEGEFYAWSAEELKTVLPDNHNLIADYFNVSKNGNWKTNRNVMFGSLTPLQYARSRKIEPGDFHKQFSAAKIALLSERSKREKPAVDKKILTSWNALLIEGFIDAYAALGDETYLQYALLNARFVENTMLEKSGKLWRNFKDGKRSVNAFLDDYAILARAYTRLYQLTFDKHWLVLSKQLVDYSSKNFYDPKSGMFFYTAHQESTLIRKIEITDNAIPSSNSVIAEVLYTLSVCFDDKEYLEKSKRMLSRMYKQLREGETNYYMSWCFLAGLFSHGTNEVVIMGRDAVTKNLELQKSYLPVSIFLGSKDDENLPLLDGKSSLGQTLIYVCTARTCKQPVEEIAQALHQINQGLPN